MEIAGTSVGTVNLFPFLGGAVFMPFLGRVLDAYPRSASGAYALEGYTTLLLVLNLRAPLILNCRFWCLRCSGSSARSPLQQRIRPDQEWLRFRIPPVRSMS